MKGKYIGECLGLCLGREFSKEGNLSQGNVWGNFWRGMFERNDWRYVWTEGIFWQEIFNSGMFGGMCWGIVQGECADPHAGLQVSTCSGYDLCYPG